MKKLIILMVMCAISLHICAASEQDDQEQAKETLTTDLEGFAKLWAHAAVTDLSAPELELMGTLLYYDMAASYYELALRKALLDLQRGSQVLAFKIMNQNNPDESPQLCTQLSTLLARVQSDLAPSRNYFLSVWQLCDKEIAESKHATLALAVENLRQLGQRALNNWATVNKQEMSNVLKQNSEKLDQTLQKLAFCKNSLLALADGNFPLNPESEFVQLQTIHNALRISQILYEGLFNAELATDEVMSLSFGMISLNAAIFSTLYEAFYEELESKNLIPMHIVIDEHGFIPAQTRDKVLPKLSAIHPTVV